MIILSITNLSPNAFLSLTQTELQERLEEAKERQEEKRWGITAMGCSVSLLGRRLPESCYSPSFDTEKALKNQTQYSSSDPLLQPSPHRGLGDTRPRCWKVPKEVSPCSNNMSVQEYARKFDS